MEGKTSPCERERKSVWEDLVDRFFQSIVKVSNDEMRYLTGDSYLPIEPKAPNPRQLKGPLKTENRLPGYLLL